MMWLAAWLAGVGGDVSSAESTVQCFSISRPSVCVGTYFTFDGGGRRGVRGKVIAHTNWIGVKMNHIINGCELCSGACVVWRQRVVHITKLPWVMNGTGKISIWPEPIKQSVKCPPRHFFTSQNIRCRVATATAGPNRKPSFVMRLRHFWWFHLGCRSCQQWQTNSGCR